MVARHAANKCHESCRRLHVFERVGALRGPIQSPYQGPFKVIERQGKYYKLDLGTRQDTVSIDRLKLAFMDEVTDINEPRHPAPAAAPAAARRPPTRPTRAARADAGVVPVVTSSGRLVRLPVRCDID